MRLLGFSILIGLVSCGGAGEPPPQPPVVEKPRAAPPKPEVAAEEEPVQAQVPGLETEWWKAEAPCPDGATLKEMSARKPRVLACVGEDGKGHGLEIRWQRVKIQVTTYKAGVLDGPFAIWALDGTKLEEGLFADGRQEGTFLTWHKKNGAKASRGAFVDDVRDGEWIYWDDSGAEVRRETYKNGVKAPASGDAGGD